MPANRVLLVDRDVDALAKLAAELRDRGVRVSLANGAHMASERARAGGYDVIIASRSVAEPREGALGLYDVLSVELSEVPPLLVLDADADAGSEMHVRRDDVERIVARIGDLAKVGKRSPRSSLIPSTHGLEHSPLGDLLVVLASERRSGTLTVTTSKGSGELRLVDGNVVDAVYMRLEGLKAITRMHADRDGAATFAPGAPAIMRRIYESTAVLVEQARELASTADTLRKEAHDLPSNVLIASEGNPEGLSETDQHVLARLRVPSVLDEILDELPHADAAILESALKLDRMGRIKRLGHVSGRTHLCGADQLHLVRANASRARPLGFAGPARMVFAATPSRLAVFGHTVLSLADAFPPQDAAPPIPVPYVVATIRLGDGVELDVAALPLVPAYAPLWPLALAGAAVVVRLDEAALQSLEEACANVNVAILDARAIFGIVEESSPVQVASLIRTALEANGVAPN